MPHGHSNLSHSQSRRRNVNIITGLGRRVLRGIHGDSQLAFKIPCALMINSAFLITFCVELALLSSSVLQLSTHASRVCKAPEQKSITFTKPRSQQMWTTYEQGGGNSHRGRITALKFVTRASIMESLAAGALASQHSSHDLSNGASLQSTLITN